MARRLIVDTGVLVEIDRGVGELTEVIADADDVAIAAITVAELRAGVELAAGRRRVTRAEFLSRVLRTLPVEPYETATAEEHGRLLAHVFRSGTQRGAHDLVIAATAIATRRMVLTTDRRARYDDLPGVTCVLVNDGPE